MPVAFQGDGGLWEQYRTWLLLESGCVAGTVSVYRRICWRFCDPAVGYLARLPNPKPWWKATAADLRTYAAAPLVGGPRVGLPPSARYRASRISVVKGLYLFAYGAGLLERDPMVLVRSPKIRVDAGLPRGSAHWLRHSGATKALEAGRGTNLEDVRQLLDHLDSRTTRRYVAAYPWRVRERAVDLIPDPRKGP